MPSKSEPTRIFVEGASVDDLRKIFGILIGMEPLAILGDLNAFVDEGTPIDQAVLWGLTHDLGLSVTHSTTLHPNAQDLRSQEERGSAGFIERSVILAFGGHVRAAHLKLRCYRNRRWGREMPTASDLSLTFVDGPSDISRPQPLGAKGLAPAPIQLNVTGLVQAAHDRESEGPHTRLATEARWIVQHEGPPQS